MFENGYEHFIVEITNEDMVITEKWLVKVHLVEAKPDEKDEDGEWLVNRKMVIELIQQFAPNEEMVLGFEVSKLPVLYLGKKEQMMLQDGKPAEIYIDKVRRKEEIEKWKIRQ